MAEFENMGEVAVWKKPVSHRLSKRIANRITAVLGLQKQQDKKIQQWIDESDVILSNTITNGDFLRAFNFLSVKNLITYVHELEMATIFFSNRQDVQLVSEISHRFLVPSQAVATHLINNLGISENAIDTLNYYIPLSDNAPTAERMTPEPFVVGLAGTLDWRKGSDIFTIAVASFFRKYPNANLQFVWKGAATNGIDHERIVYELKKLQLLEKVNILPSSKDMNGFYQSIDVLLLLSKEDPYPLVVLEAANHYKPCICFRNAGGAPEFVRDDAGDTVPYLDLDKLASTIYQYYSNRSVVTNKGQTAHARYKDLHFNRELILAQFKKAIGQQPQITGEEAERLQA